MTGDPAFVESYLAETVRLLQSRVESKAQILQAAEAWKAALRRGGKILYCGNGESAADAQHLAGELMGRFLFDRDPMPALSLTVDTQALTATGNDYGYDKVFSRQLRGIGVARDVLVGLSTLGNSANVVQAFEVAREISITTIGLTGEAGGALRPSPTS